MTTSYGNIGASNRKDTVACVALIVAIVLSVANGALIEVIGLEDAIAHNERVTEPSHV